MERRDWEGLLRIRKRKDGTDDAMASGQQSKLLQKKVRARQIHKVTSPVGYQESGSASLLRRSTRLIELSQVDGKPLEKCCYQKEGFSIPPHLGVESPSSKQFESNTTSVSENSNNSESDQSEISQGFDYKCSPKCAIDPISPKRRQSERLKNRSATDCSTTGSIGRGVTGMSKRTRTYQADPISPKRRQSERLKNRGATDCSTTGSIGRGVTGISKRTRTYQADDDEVLLPLNDSDHEVLLALNGSECRPGVVGVAYVEYDSDGSINKFPHELTDDLCCFACQVGLAGNLLLLCDGDGCDCALHTFCLNPPMQAVPEGSWLCPNCKGALLTDDLRKQHWFTNKKVQSVVGRRWICIETDQNVMQEQCLIKWHTFSHHHDTWVPVEWLYQVDRARFHNFRRVFLENADTMTIDLRRPEWFTIARVIGCREKSNTTKNCDILNLCHQSQQDGQFEYFVKWKGLEYSDSTWETSCTEELLVEFNKLVGRHQKANERCDSQSRKFQSFQLDEQPCYLTGGALFAYQIFGVNWILSNFQIRRNVILADEMGLGKTIQVISFVCCMKEEYLSNYPVLIIAPKSTLPQWEQEFHHWAKQLNIIIYQGDKMSRHYIQKHELYSSANKVLFDGIITNYELVFSDSSMLRKFKWSAIIIDEAHKIKNLDCKLTSCLKQLDTEFRLLLTGTPLQNTLLELFALLHFLDPEEFSDPRERAESFSTIGMDLADSGSLNSDMKVSQIHDLLRPRMLRRMKSEVLFSSIPGKRWVEVPCALSNFQRQLYVNLLKKNYRELNKGLSNGGKLVLNFLLMELRKCCNHPYLFPGQESLNLSREDTMSALIAASGKLQLLEKLLPKLKARGNRVLLFSQMTRMLDILEDFLVFLGLTYFRIDGKTNASARQQQIQEFNNPECKVFIFLISTRAGGLGIDLPSADRVIIYDPDFNPFTDLQAQSRAHRIGQSRPVMVYQLITKCSVEEKILEKSKRKLAIENLVMNPKTKLDVKELHSVLLHGARKILSKKSVDATSFNYDDDAIETLLNMDPEPDEKYVPEENGYLGGIQSFIPLPEQDPSSSPKTNDWPELLAECKSNARRSEDFGRGKRHKSAVKYFREDIELNEEPEEEVAGDDTDKEYDEYAPEEAGETSSDDSSDGYAPDEVEMDSE